MRREGRRRMEGGEGKENDPVLYSTRYDMPTNDYSSTGITVTTPRSIYSSDKVWYVGMRCVVVCGDEVCSGMWG